MKNEINSEYYSILSNLKNINKNSIILDIGANIGNVTDFLYTKFEPNIYSYEPNISCYNFMKKRFEGINKIRIFNFAVSDFDGKSHLYFHVNAKGINDTRYIEGATLRPQKDNIDRKKKLEIECIDIKKIIKKFDKIDLIKIDIEGSEYTIMPEIIKNRDKITRVICETHGNPNGKKFFTKKRPKIYKK
ncbi:FkbM family methyltransferase [bacterium]|nr:FkbM family methyltransferase [bacterium]